MAVAPFAGLANFDRLDLAVVFPTPADDGEMVAAGRRVAERAFFPLFQAIIRKAMVGLRAVVAKVATVDGHGLEALFLSFFSALMCARPQEQESTFGHLIDPRCHHLHVAA